MARTWIKFIFYLSLLISVTLGIIPHGEHHHYFWWQRIPASYALLGFLGCIFLVIFSKGLGHAWLQKEEDYYD